MEKRNKILENMKKIDERMGKGLLSMSARLFFVFLVGAVMVSVNISPAFASGATITTDKTKYSLGETMTITGAGFTANSPVTVTVLRPDKVTDTLPVVIADSSGNFTTSYTPPAIPGRYKITARDETNTAITASTEADASTNWLQCAENDAAHGKPLGVGYCNWIGSELNSNNALLYEGAATNQEDVFTGLASGKHTLVFGIQATKGGKHTYDWLVSDAQATAADAADGITLQLNHCTAGDTTTCNNLEAGGHFVDIPYPADPFISKDGNTQDKINAYNALFPSGQTIRLYSDADITAYSLTLAHSGSKESFTPLANQGDTGDSYIWYTLNWTSTGSSVMLWADADIALGGDGTGRSWGAGLGASNVSGSPYHFYQISLDGVGGGGSLDNQMAASAVFIPPTTPTVTTQVQNASNVDITGQSVLIGTVVHDNATVDTGSASVTIPSGSTFTFHLYANGTCTAPSMTDQTGVAVPSGAQTGSANSNTFTPGVGSYSYMVNFTSGNTASVTNATGVCEPFTVTGVPNTTVNISSSAAIIQTGSSVTLTVTENNTGTVPLTNPNVTLTGGLSTTLVKSSGSFVSGDTNNNGILDVGEIWTWSLNSGTLTSSATFTATGHGFDPLNNDITYPYYVNEQNAVSVTVVDAQINITGDSTNEVGQAHTFTVTVKKNLGDGAGLVAASGVTVTSGITATGSIIGGTCTTTTTDGSGQCTIIVNSTNAGTSTVNASTTFAIGSVTVTRATGDGLSGDSDNTHKTWVDAQINITGDSTNAVGVDHTFTVTVKKDPGTGLVVAPGETVTSGITGIGSITGGSCTTGPTDSSGQCTIVVNSTNAGTGTVNASTTIVVGGVSLTRATGDGLSGDSPNTHKTWVDAQINITGDSTNEVGQAHTFTVTVKKNLGDGAGLVAANGVTVTSGITGTGSIIGGTCTTTTTDGSGQCTIIVNSTTAGTGTVNASTTFAIGGVTVTRATGDGLSGNSPNTHKTWVDANIVLSPLRATNNISSPHTITATVKQDLGDGAGLVNAPNGTLVTFSLINSGGATSNFVGGVNTCTTTSGTCSVQINSSTPGSVDIHATTTFSVGGVSLTRETGDGLSGDSANANKIYVAGSLKVTKVVDLGSVVNPTAISQDFTVNVTGPSYPSGHDIVFHLVNGVLQAPTSVTLSPLIPGQYNVVEAGAGANWSEVVATSPVDVVANDIAEVTVTNTYVPGSLKVAKELNLSTYPFNVTTSFSVNVTGPSYPSGTILTLDVVNGVLTNSPQTLNNLIPGSYNVTEADPGIAWIVTGGGDVTVNPDATANSTVNNTLKQPHTTISITLSVFETAPGENVILTIKDTNDGFVPLTNPYVNLTYDSTTVTLNKTNLVSGDNNDNGIMDVGETWTWSYTVLISNTTTFNVAGHGLDPLGNDISPTNGYTTEAGTVTVRTIGATRTLGFWQTHTNFTSFVFNTYLGGGMPIGTAPHKGVITNTLSPGQSQLFGGFYAPIAKTTTGVKRGQIDQARIQLLQQLMAAKLNCAAFGCSATIQGQIANADSVYATGTKDQILAAASQMDAYNNGGDDIAIPPSLPPTGKATPDKSQSYANITFWNSP